MLALVQSVLGHPARDAATSDLRLIEQARRGDRDALEALYKRFSPTAFTLALRLTGDRDRAHDVVQDAFLRAFERLDSFRADAPFAAWLKRIVANVTIDRARSERRWLMQESELHTLPTQDSDAGRELDALGLLARLPMLARSVLVLYELEGHTHQEIATLLGRTEVWSKTILSRTRSKLAALIQAQAK
jgi:RNA polymerase sigma-70 factor (ECF subfamily)